MECLQLVQCTPCVTDFHGTEFCYRIIKHDHKFHDTNHYLTLQEFGINSTNCKITNSSQTVYKEIIICYEIWTIYVSALATQQDMQLAIYHVPGQLGLYSNCNTGWMTVKSWFHWQEGQEIVLFFQSIKPSHGVLPASCSIGTRD